MKKLCTLLTSVALMAVVGTSAQESAMPYSKIPATKNTPDAVSPAPAQKALRMPTRLQEQTTQQSIISVEHQIHSPIRWYALENADNPEYWKSVNTSQIWLELEVGTELTDPEIADFLAKNELGAPVKESMHPHVTNFFVFEKSEATAEEIIVMAESARSVPGVLFLEPSVIYKGNFIPNDPFWNQQWGPYAIFADEAWDFGTQGENSWNVLAVLDDAIDYTHEDLSDQVWYGYDYGFDDNNPYPDDPVQKHGTHVTGIMSASNNNGIGIAGMCTDTVYFAKVTDNSYFTDNGVYSDVAIINALYDIGLYIPRVSVINLSLGGGAPSAAAEQAFNFVWNNDMLSVAASGNDLSSSVSYPAAYQACMAVGSIGTDGNSFYLASYSNYGSEQEVTAPGGDFNTGYGIFSTIPDNQYEQQQGTSMACPHVAGLAGLMKSLNTDLTNAEIRDIINATCLDLGPQGYDIFYGYGMVNAKLALEVALGAVSTNEIEADLGLKIYPNPVANQLFIQHQNFNGQGEFQIYDLNGRMVLSDNANSGLFSVDVSHLSQGVYVVHFNTNGQRYTSKFVKSNG